MTAQLSLRMRNLVPNYRGWNYPLGTCPSCLDTVNARMDVEVADGRTWHTWCHRMATRHVRAYPTTSMHADQCWCWKGAVG